MGSKNKISSMHTHLSKNLSSILLVDKQQHKTTIMKTAITTLLMILIVNPQFIDASPMPAPNIVECDLDPTLEGCNPSAEPTCQCNGHLSNTNTGLKIGECNHDAGSGFFCYIDADQTECCEKESTRYTRYCVNYSACSNHPWNSHKDTRTRGPVNH